MKTMKVFTLRFTGRARTARSGGLLAAVLLVFGCQQAPEPGEAPSEAPTASEAGAAAGTVPGGPALPYLVKGACPFECCTYGRWTATAPLEAYSEASDTKAAVFSIASGTAFAADTGFVRVTSAGLAVTARPVEVYGEDGTSRMTEAGDTLYLLDYAGEGAFNAWYADGVYQLAGPSAYARPGDGPPVYEVAQKPVQEWWVQASLDDGRRGWLLMNPRDLQVKGADTCAGS